MKKLPCIKAVVPETERARQLRQWLRDRSVDLALLDDSEDAEPAVAGTPLEAGPPVAAGQVRLMHPQAEATSARLCYLAVLREARPGLFLAAPFARFPVPALPVTRDDRLDDEEVEDRDKYQSGQNLLGFLRFKSSQFRAGGGICDARPSCQRS